MISRISRSLVTFSLVALLVLAVAACTIEAPAGPTINVNNTNVNTVTIATVEGGTPSKAGCPVIARIQINYPETLGIGLTAPFSVTPKDSAGKDRPADCDIADGLTITAQPSDLLSITDKNAFDTTLKGIKAGDVSVGVRVGTANASVRVTVK